ncbi:hypothetical protein BH23ACT3_BH23ACT3_24030 [soil metagenome]
MRQIFSVRFFVAIGAVFGLFMLITAIFGGDPVAELRDVEPVSRQVDLVAEVFVAVQSDFEMGDDGVTRGSLDLVLDADRTVRVVSGTYGEVTCDELERIGACAVVADLLGDAVVWFALVPIGPAGTVEFAAIDVLDDDFAVLVNGWRVPFAPVLDRRCAQEFASYRDFRDELGDEFTSIYDIDERRLTAVVCT